MKLIDISHVLDENTPIFPGDCKTALSKYKTIEKDCYNAYVLQSGLHTGTHIDIPMHLINDDKTVKDFPADCFVGKGVLLDVRGEDVIQMKPVYREIVGEQDIVLLFTGFDKYYFQDKYFANHPTASDELAEFLLSKKIKMLGMDMPAPDYPPFTFHKELLRKGIFVLENLTNLQSLIDIADFEVIALPLKINAEASLVRAVCRVNEESIQSALNK
ncbi:MAG: cyclase family protein [Oscillospiraceae bacterium]|nr:cyclase family protein [Oscillospiraceae bacterium]